MHSRSPPMTHDVIGAAIEVHKDKGPGLLEMIGWISHLYTRKLTEGVS